MNLRWIDRILIVYPNESIKFIQRVLIKSTILFLCRVSLPEGRYTVSIKLEIKCIDANAKYCVLKNNFAHKRKSRHWVPWIY